MGVSMRIMCLIGQLGNGGSEKQLHLFLKHLDRDRFDPVVVVSSYVNEFWRERITNGLGVHMIQLEGLPSALKLAKFRWLVWRHAADVVFSWSFFTNAFRVASGSRPRFIGSHRGGIEEERAALSQRRFKLCLGPEVIVVNSSLLADELRGEGVPDSRIAVVNNIFEPLEDNASEASRAKTRRQVRERFGIGADEVLVVGAGRNSEGKDFPFWVEVFAGAAKSIPKLRGLIIGSGGEGVSEEISRRGLDARIITPGEIPEGRRILAAADIFFLSSKMEGMPNVLLEAVDAGCAILSTAAGGVKEILGSDHDCPSGFVVDIGDAEAAVERLVRLAGDAPLRQSMAAAARVGLPRFSPGGIVPLYQALLEKGAGAVKPL